MLIGVPKEIKNNEFRIGLTPAGVKEMVHHGHRSGSDHTSEEPQPRYESDWT